MEPRTRGIPEFHEFSRRRGRKTRDSVADGMGRDEGETYISAVCVSRGGTRRGGGCAQGKWRRGNSPAPGRPIELDNSQFNVCQPSFEILSSRVE